MTETSDSANLNGEPLDNVSEVKSRRLKRAGRIIAKTALSAGIIGASFAEGLLLASAIPTSVPFGNSQANTTITFDGNVIAETGMLGSFKKPIENPVKFGPIELGANLDIGEIAQPPFKEAVLTSDEVSIEKIVSSVDERTVSYYGEIYRNVSSDQPEIANDIKNHILKLSLLAGGANSGLMVVGASIGKEGRRKLLKSPGMYLTLLALAQVVVIAHPESPSYDWQPTSSSFDGTVLEDVEVSGGIANLLVNKLGKEVIQYVQETDASYEKADQSAKDALANRWLLSDEYRLDKEVSLLLFYTDNHCNPGTPSVMSTTAKTMGIDLAADGGDTTASGTKFEDLCVKTTTEAFGKNGVKIVQVPGNHDSFLTSGQLKRRGVKVLGGNVVKVDGISFLGDADPRASRLGTPIQYISSKSLEDVGKELKEEACKSDEMPIIIQHDRSAAKEAIESGCVKLALTGHTHKQKIITYILPDGSKSYVVNGGTSGGAKENQLTYGKLENPAQFFVVAQKDGELVALQDFKINTDSSFEVGDIVKFEE